MRRRIWVLLVIAALVLVVWVLHRHFGTSHAPLAHAHSEFTFTVQAPEAVVFPLFGPEGERPWAGRHWNPHFIYPSAPQDIEGAVFSIAHGHHSATWINTAFDPQAGHAAYVYVVDGKLATRIDVQLTPIDAATTKVRVMYERTALSPSVNRDVAEMTEIDPKMGPDWERSIGEYLKGRGKEHRATPQ